MHHQLNEKKTQEDWKCERQSGKKPSVADPTPDSECFRCGKLGHHQVRCPNDPICYKCKNPGHMAVNCPENKKLKLRMFGFSAKG
uniref:CCHC-type domain-containing protein n=1 Tax=Arundo donax TaxID=35708 RepID=A0A0A9C0E6_ARUDO